MKGNGSGDHAAEWQLKIIHSQITDHGGKKATYHFTVSKQVFDALAVEAEAVEVD